MWSKSVQGDDWSAARLLTYRGCDQIPTGAVWTVSATTNVGCGKARKVIRKVLGGNHHPLGYNCQEGQISQYEGGLVLAPW